MRTAYRIIVIILATVFLQQSVFSQANTYIINGSAIRNNCNCYRLTPALNQQSGSVWNATKINLNNPFDFTFNVFLGCADEVGADGMVFILQPISTSIGATGEGMGFSGIAPSIGITLDTWHNANLNDPDFDHISIQANGIVAHGNDLAGPEQASAIDPNIEDCNWHHLRITWEPVTHFLRAYFDEVPRVETQTDLVTDIFNNDPMVYWGFSAATGGASNLQQFCTALNPGFNTNLATNTTCINSPVFFYDLSQSFTTIASYYWDFGDGTTSNVANPPPHFYPGPGSYDVRFAFGAQDGCMSDTVRRTIIVGSIPLADFDIIDTCSGKSPRIINRSSVSVGNIAQWTWTLDGNPVSNVPQPVLLSLLPGPHELTLIVLSGYGCFSNTVVKNFTIKSSPVVDIQVTGGCINQVLPFTGIQIDNITSINSWNWNFGDGQTSQSQSPAHVFSNPGNKIIRVTATDNQGCISNEVTKNIFINRVIAFAGNDTAVLKNVPFRLNSSYTEAGNSPLTFNWAPPTGLDNTNILVPASILQNDQTYYLTINSADGCVANDSVNITIFKGSAVYVPSGFTPNGDGRNETLKPMLIGISSLDFFNVYNRWGQIVFNTKTAGKGWDGKFMGVPQPSGLYVWVLKARDITGKLYQLKGTVMIIR